MGSGAVVQETKQNCELIRPTKKYATSRPVTKFYGASGTQFLPQQVCSLNSWTVLEEVTADQNVLFSHCNNLLIVILLGANLPLLINF